MPWDGPGSYYLLCEVVAAVEEGSRPTQGWLCAMM